MVGARLQPRYLLFNFLRQQHRSRPRIIPSAAPRRRHRRHRLSPPPANLQPRCRLRRLAHVPRSREGKRCPSPCRLHRPRQELSPRRSLDPWWGVASRSGVFRLSLSPRPRHRDGSRGDRAAHNRSPPALLRLSRRHRHARGCYGCDASRLPSSSLRSRRCPRAVIALPRR